VESVKRETKEYIKQIQKRYEASIDGQKELAVEKRKAIIERGLENIDMHEAAQLVAPSIDRFTDSEGTGANTSGTEK